jgi:glycosyltransferase involved in cell wall biosynthesis
MRIGIGITTRNRNELLRRCVDSILLHTLSPHTLVIVDDASQEPVVEPRAKVIRHSQRKGIACSKNDCLRALRDCDHIFLFDDDCWPIREGWETQYIEASLISGCHLFCYVWETGNPSHEPFHIKPVQWDYYLHIADQRYLITEEQAAHSLQVKLSMGYGYGQGHSVVAVPTFHIRLFTGGPGVMMYMDSHCVEKLGGFCEEFPMYGGEHTDFFIRGFNMGLSPAKATDIVGSEELFEALDRNNASHQSTVQLKEEMIAIAQHALDRRLASTERVIL